MPATTVIGLISGGDTALRNPVEGAEDDTEQVWKENGITVTNAGQCGDYLNPVRFYKNTTVHSA